MGEFEDLDSLPRRTLVRRIKISPRAGDDIFWRARVTSTDKPIPKEFHLPATLDTGFRYMSFLESSGDDGDDITTFEWIYHEILASSETELFFKVAAFIRDASFLKARGG